MVFHIVRNSNNNKLLTQISYNRQVLMREASRSVYWRVSTMRVIQLLTIFVIIESAFGIMCYHCNSLYDPRCGDPFSSFSLGVVNCSIVPVPENLNEVESNFCRKTIQKGLKP